MDISTEAVLERQTLKATDPYSGNQYHLLYNPPTTEDVKERLRINPNLAQETVMARLAEYHAERDELLEFYSGLGAQRVNADQDMHTVFESLEGLIVNPLPSCGQSVALPSCTNKWPRASVIWFNVRWRTCPGFVQILKSFFPGLSRTRSIHKHGLHEVKKCIYKISYQCISITANK